MINVQHLVSVLGLCQSDLEERAFQVLPVPCEILIDAAQAQACGLNHCSHSFCRR